MSNLEAFLAGANVVTSFKDNKFRAMTCAWAMMCDYDKVMLLLGSQSDTGKAIQKGDIVGVSGLSNNQKLIAKHFGDNHSDSFAKFNQHYLEKFHAAYVVKEAKTKLCCEVIDVLHLPGIEADALLYLRVVDYKEDSSKTFLSCSEVFDD